MASDDEETDFSHWQSSQNRKQKKAGGWQSLGLDHTIFKAIEKKGFKQPTPIQRKTIPCVLDGKDVVAMSRTGSGKTAAFVIPMLHRLKRRDTKGIRALLISPTRELAMQTFKVVKELGRFTGLRCAILVGGDSIEDQFSTIHENPDILIATPGRLLHIVVEMDLRMHYVQYVVFDEADRLFEMGFQDQLTETLKRIPESRQTLLFSATLPKMLVDFAKAGLSDPMLIRLDVDEKISDRLSLVFAICRPDDKMAALLHLCRKLDEEKKQTIVFCATMKHVEYVSAFLIRAGIDNSFIYSQLDATARKNNIYRFREKKNNILVVTDVAARGVDIPLLDMAINLHFPPKAKLFIHRVGRVARAGRSGTAISLVGSDELPYMADLFLFLGKPLRFAKDEDTYDAESTIIGRVPDSVISLESEFLQSNHDYNEEMKDLRQKSVNAMMRYIRTRPPPSAESARRVKDSIRKESIECAAHPFLRIEGDQQRYDILNQLSNYKSQATIFELNIGSKAQSAQVMKQKRKAHENIIKERKEMNERKLGKKAEDIATRSETQHLDDADEDEMQSVFSQVIGRESKAAPTGNAKKKNALEERRREKERHFVSYTSADIHTESQLALTKVDFAKQAEGVAVDIIADDDKGIYNNKNAKRWDRKKKRFVGLSLDDPANKKMRTEDGTWLPASYKSGHYEDWKKNQKIRFNKNDDNENMDESTPEAQPRRKNGRFKKNKGTPNMSSVYKGKSELKNRDQIIKERKKSAKKQDYMEYRRQSNLKKTLNGGVNKKGRAGGGGKASKQRR